MTALGPIAFAVLVSAAITVADAAYSAHDVLCSGRHHRPRPRHWWTPWRPRTVHGDGQRARRLVGWGYRAPRRWWPRRGKSL